jgi:hypothetical protein
MGYGYAETFLVIFLTHPGVIAFAGPKMLSAAMGPAQESPIALSAFWQVMLSWILSLPGERSAAFGWTMYAIYLVFLGVYVYLFGRTRLMQGS